MSVPGRDLLRKWIDDVRGAFGASPRRESEPELPGGPFLHWVPDHDGFRLAGDFLPPSTGRPRPAAPATARSRRRSRRA